MSIKHYKAFIPMNQPTPNKGKLVKAHCATFYPVRDYVQYRYL